MTEKQKEKIALAALVGLQLLFCASVVLAFLSKP